jgi:hypothetical protein
MKEQVMTSNMQQHATIEHAKEIKRKEKRKTMQKERKKKNGKPT